MSFLSGCSGGGLITQTNESPKNPARFTVAFSHARCWFGACDTLGGTVHTIQTRGPAPKANLELRTRAFWWWGHLPSSRLLRLRPNMFIVALASELGGSSQVPHRRGRLDEGRGAECGSALPPAVVLVW